MNSPWTFAAPRRSGRLQYSTYKIRRMLLQDALNVARPPEVSCIALVVKPTANRFQQRTRFIRPSLHSPEFRQACDGARKDPHFSTLAPAFIQE
jgi:hypothetical protein